MTAFLRAQFHRGVSPAVLLLALLLVAGVCSPGVALASIVYTGSSSGANNGLPTDMTAGALTITRPAGTVAGQALIASIAARPHGMTVTVPANWYPMTVTEQTSGGSSTLPQGMTLLTYYHIVGLAEPASYTWTFANTAGSGANYGGSAVGGLLAFSGIDTAGGNPINMWSFKLTPSGTTHSTNSITPTVTDTMIVSSISYLSGDSFANPTGIAGIVERLDQRAPAAVNAVGTTLQMSTAPWPTATATGSSQAVAASGADNGVGHLMALKPADIDPGITMARSGPLNPGGSASYTLTVTNNGIKPEPGPISVVNDLPTGLTYNATGSGGTGWSCSAALQRVTCTRAGSLAGGATAVALVLNVNVSAGATGTLINTATVSGTGGDANMYNNTATDSYTLAVDLALTMSSGALNPGQNGTYTLNVSNIGTATDPGPITITDTLPAVLSYVSGTGTGWTCLVGPPVTCTRTGTLGNGAAAGTLTLTVAVAAGASGTINNTATVTGTATDSTLANNTASDSYIIALATYAYYKMDEASWNGMAGEVLDSSGNSRNASRIGGTVNTVAAPASGLKGDTCRGGSISATAGSGVSTGIDINNDIGNSGTISFWYSSNTAWNDGTDRILFDASNDLGTGGADKHFYLVKGDGGELRFALEDDQDDNEMLSSGGNSFPAGQWHHIAVTWDWVTSKRMYLYLDGVAVGNNTINDNIGNYSTLLIGLAQTGITGADTDYTTNAANGVIDEVRIYTSALTLAQIQTDMNATHSCFVFDHLRIKHDGEGSTCAAESITVEACANALCTSLVTAGGISATLLPFGTAVSIDTSGSQTLSVTPSSFPGANTLNATSINPVPTNTTVSCLNTATSIASCTMYVSACPGGSNFNCLETSITPYSSGTAKLYTKLAGTAFSFDVVALNSSGAVETNYVVTGAAAKNVTVELFDDSTSSACSAYASPLASQTLSFVSTTGRNTTASFTVPNAYRKLSCRVTDANMAPTAYGCSTDDFSVRPAAFVVAKGTPTLNAGSTFTVQATAVLSDLSTTATTYLGTPILNIGQIIGTPGFTSAALAPQILPAATLGISVGNTFTYDDVGSFTLPATSPGTYGISDSTFTSVDGSSDCVANSASNTALSGKYGCLIGQSAALTVGAFIPDHFEITPSFTAGCSSGGFTYMDQPFTLGYTVTAKSKSRGSPNPPGNTALKLYSGGKLNLAALNGSTDWVARLLPAVTYPLTPTWTNGSYTPAITSYTFTRPIITSADPTWGAFDTLNIGVAIDDADGVGYATSPTMPTLPPTFTGATPASCTKSGATACRTYASLTGGALAKMRYGRARILNAYGSELLDLPMTLRAQYWNGTGWVQNTNDNCTGDAAPPAANAVNVTLVMPSANFTCVRDTGQPGGSGAGCTTAGPTTPIDKQFREGPAMVIGPASLQKGDFNLWLQKPTGPGNVTVTVDVPTWLEFNWTGTVGDPSARATFGIYKSPLIYRRENY